MERVTAYCRKINDNEYEHAIQSMFDIITIKSKETGEVFKKDAGNLWIYFHERLKKAKKPYLVENFANENGINLSIAYGFGDTVSKKLEEIKKKQKEERERQKELEEKKRDNEINIIVFGCPNPEHNNWYIKDKEGNLTCYPKEALKLKRVELKELIKKFREKAHKKRANGTYIVNFDLVDPKKYFENHIDVVDGEIDNVEYEERGYTGYYDIHCYSKGKLQYSYEVSTGCSYIENYLGPLYPNADIPWEDE